MFCCDIVHILNLNASESSFNTHKCSNKYGFRYFRYIKLVDLEKIAAFIKWWCINCINLIENAVNIFRRINERYQLLNWLSLKTTILKTLFLSSIFVVFVLRLFKANPIQKVSSFTAICLLSRQLVDIIHTADGVSLGFIHSPRPFSLKSHHLAPALRFLAGRLR